MTIQIPGVSDATDASGAPDGSPTRAAALVIQGPKWYPDRGFPFVEPDALFVQDFTDGADVLARGGVDGAQTTYFDPATVKMPIADGPYAGWSEVGPRDDAAKVLVIPTVGLIRAEQFTLPLLLKHLTLDIHAWSGKILYVGRVGSRDALAIYKSTNTTLSARCYVDGVAQSEATISGLVSGDGAADTYVAVSVVVNGTSLKLYLGNNAKSATVTMGSALRSFAFEGGSIAYLSDNDGGSTSEGVVAGLQTLNHARTPATAPSITAPTVTVDADTTDGAVVPAHLAGVLGQYAGFRSDQADDVALGSTSIRDQAIAAACADGLPLIRIDHIFDKPVSTGSGATPAIADSEWLKVLAPVDEMVANGTSPHVHVTFDFTPSALRSTSNIAEIPNDNDGFAKLCSDFVTFCKTRYGSSVVANQWFFTLWNEPSDPSFWAGTGAQLSTLYGVIATKLAADHPTVAFSHVDQEFASADDSPSRQVVIDHAAQLTFLGMHAYVADDWSTHDNIADMQAYAESQGAAANLPVRVGEWVPDYDQHSRYASMTTSTDARMLTRVPSGTVREAAIALTRMWHFAEAGVLSAAFTRLGTWDAGLLAATGPAEAYNGLFTATDPPRPLPVYAAFQAAWKLTGSRVTATSNHPGLKALAAKDTDGTITVAYATFREWGDLDELLRFNFALSGLPASFTWKLWRLDRRDEDYAATDGRLRLIAEGDESNVPMGADLTLHGVGCLQITP